MKNNIYKIFLFVSLIGILASCKKTDEPTPKEVKTEHKYIRILVSDEVTTELNLLNPETGELKSFTSKFPKSALYTTASGRFATIIHRDNNFVETFDTGFEFHGDHVDVKGTPKFGALTGDMIKPTHFKSKGDEIITFNDGDATLSIAKESEFHTPGIKMKTINAGITAHHGAMTKFDNGSYAITIKDGSVAGTLPERVKIINSAGVEVAASTIQTTGIHGNASDGKVSLFGSGSGILMVEQSGTQQLIPHPTNFGTAWFGTIMEAKTAKKLIGFTAAMGVYNINVVTKQITPIIESKDIMQCKIDYAGKNLLVLLFDGTLKIYDLATGIMKREGNVIEATAKDAKYKPILAGTDRYMYLLMQKSSEVYQINTDNFTDIKKTKISGAPHQLTILGFENSHMH